MLKIALYGYTGSGKSTTAKILKKILENDHKKVSILKLAQPLYEMQAIFYKFAGKSIEFYMQDQILLEAIALQLRRISQDSIVVDFLKRLNLIDTDVVINDDLRNVSVDYPVLKENDFRFIRIKCDEQVRLKRLNLRHDLSTNIQSSTTNNIDLIKPHAEIDSTDGDMQKLEIRIHEVLQELL